MAYQIADTQQQTGHASDTIQVYVSDVLSGVGVTVQQVVGEALIPYVGLRYVADCAEAFAQAVPWLARYRTLMWAVIREDLVVARGRVFMNQRRAERYCMRCGRPLPGDMICLENHLEETE